MSKLAQILFALAAIGCLVLGSPAAFADAPAGSIDSPSLQSVLRAHSTELATVASDPQALALFSSRIGPALDLKDSLAVLAGKANLRPEKDSKETLAADLSDTAIRLTSELAAWRLALALLQVTDQSPSSLETLVRETSAQQSWLTGQDRRRHLRLALQVGAVLAAMPLPPAMAPAMTAAYDAYAAAIDRTYPNLAGSNDSWLTLVEQEGAAGVGKRLREGDTAAGAGDGQALGAYYFHVRLRPVFTAHLVASAIRAGAEAERQADKERLHLMEWRDRLREQRGLTRLCGTWQWIVHNHQNHQEHKLMMTFPPPGAQTGPGPRPMKVVVMGDAVYLRWEFERGIVQEDSLLFGGEGQRLEGTFYNSAGPWGSITAKRAGTCPRGDAAPTAASPATQNEPASTPRSHTPSRR